MRLGILERERGPWRRIVLAAVGAVFRPIFGRVPDPIYFFSYRPRFFAVPFVGYANRGLLKKKEWSRGEAELFAAFVSRQNECKF